MYQVYNIHNIVYICACFLVPAGILLLLLHTPYKARISGLDLNIPPFEGRLSVNLFTRNIPGIAQRTVKECSTYDMASSKGLELLVVSSNLMVTMKTLFQEK